jgi:hypothetical protein
VVEHLAQVIEAGLVGHHVAHRDAFLAGLGELGPVLRDRVVVVEETLVGERVEGGRRHPLRRREARGHGVLAPGRPPLVPRAAPHIDDLLATVVHAERRAAAASGELAAEHFSDQREVGVQVAVHGVPPTALVDGRVQPTWASFAIEMEI